MPEKTAYKRLETDEEFRKRCCTGWCLLSLRGEELDRHVEMWHEKQRKIIEVYP